MDRVLQTLGLAYRARKVVLGEEVLNQIEQVKLLFIAKDISSKSKERFLKKCDFYSIDYVDSYSGLELSNSLGKNNVKVIGITDIGFKKTLLK